MAGSLLFLGWTCQSDPAASHPVVRLTLWRSDVFSVVELLPVKAAGDAFRGPRRGCSSRCTSFRTNFEFLKLLGTEGQQICKVIHSREELAFSRKKRTRNWSSSLFHSRYLPDTTRVWFRPFPGTFRSFLLSHCLYCRSSGEGTSERQHRRHKGNKQLQCNMMTRQQVTHWWPSGMD